MAPECVMHGQFLPQSDLYCFGILLVEIVSGMRNECSNQPEHAADLAWQQWANGTAQDLVDPALADQFPIHEVLTCIQIGLLCIQADAADRPSMSEIVLMLSSHTITTPVPLQPHIFFFCRQRF
ncbi:unnamed protein product, partial [Vitis vinifera]